MGRIRNFLRKFRSERSTVIPVRGRRRKKKDRMSERSSISRPGGPWQR